MLIKKRKSEIAFKNRKNKLLKYIKKNYCEFNGETAFLEINKILLENYLEYYTLFSWQSHENKKATKKQLLEIIALFNKLIENNYDTPAINYLRQHCKYNLQSETFTWDNDENKQEWLSLIKKAEQQYRADLIKAFESIGKYCLFWWD